MTEASRKGTRRAATCEIPRLRLVAVVSLVILGMFVGLGGSASARVAAASSNSRPFIICICGPGWVPFFSPTVRGAKDAAKLLGVKLQYSQIANFKNPTGDTVTLLRQALGRHPDAMIVTDFTPSAYDGLIRQAVKNGIPVVLTNVGETALKDTGALTYVGMDPTEEGAAAGTAAIGAGIRHLVCIDDAPTNVSLEQECAGTNRVMTAAGRTMIRLDIPLADSNNPSAVTSDIQAFLLSHKTIDGIDTLDTGIEPDVFTAIANAGRTGIKVGTTDISTQVLTDIKAGKLAWDIAQQPYLQGFLPVLIAYQYIKYGLSPTQPIITGGQIVNKANVNKLLSVQLKYKGILGSQ